MANPLLPDGTIDWANFNPYTFDFSANPLPSAVAPVTSTPTPAFSPMTQVAAQQLPQPVSSAPVSPLSPVTPASAPSNLTPQQQAYIDSIAANGGSMLYGYTNPFTGQTVTNNNVTAGQLASQYGYLGALPSTGGDTRGAPVSMVDGKVFYSNFDPTVQSGNSDRISNYQQNWVDPTWAAANTTPYTDPTTGKTGFLIDPALTKDPNFATTNVAGTNYRGQNTNTGLLGSGPLGMIASIASAIPGPWQIPAALLTGLNAVETGNVGQLASAAMPFVPMGALNSAVGAQLGTSPAVTSALTKGLTTAGISGLAGADLSTALKAGALTGAGSYAGNYIGDAAKAAELDPALTKALSSGANTLVASGGNPTAALINAAASGGGNLIDRALAPTFDVNLQHNVDPTFGQDSVAAGPAVYDTTPQLLGNTDPTYGQDSAVNGPTNAVTYSPWANTTPASYETPTTQDQTSIASPTVPETTMSDSQDPLQMMLDSGWSPTDAQDYMSQAQTNSDLGIADSLSPYNSPEINLMVQNGWSPENAKAYMDQANMNAANGTSDNISPYMNNGAGAIDTSKTTGTQTLLQKLLGGLLGSNAPSSNTISALVKALGLLNSYQGGKNSAAAGQGALNNLRSASFTSGLTPVSFATPGAGGMGNPGQGKMLGQVMKYAAGGNVPYRSASSFGQQSPLSQLMGRIQQISNQRGGGYAVPQQSVQQQRLAPPFNGKQTVTSWGAQPQLGMIPEQSMAQTTPTGQPDPNNAALWGKSLGGGMFVSQDGNWIKTPDGVFTNRQESTMPIQMSPQPAADPYAAINASIASYSAPGGPGYVTPKVNTSTWGAPGIDYSVPAATTAPNPFAANPALRTNMPVQTPSRTAYAHGGGIAGGLGAIQCSPHYVSGGASGQADNVQARLSPGEYVMDADTVSNLGDGNNAAGASALDQMRQNIRTHKRSAPASKIPPKAKAPMQYLGKGK